jgi:AcrR family transcriptional regulator
MASQVALQMPAPASPKVASRQNRTRERILAESVRLFLAQGFENVSVEAIVAAAEIARSSFYRFFSNREEVLASIIRPVFEGGLGMMKDVARQPADQALDGVLGMYLQLWRNGPEALRLATRMGGAYFRLFEDVHGAYRRDLTSLLRRMEPTGLLVNGSGDYTARLLARTAVPVLEVYAKDPQLESLFRRTMNGLLIKTEA